MAKPRGWKPGAIIAGRYRLEALLGRGGMGSVWSAYDSEVELRVALKRLNPALGKNVQTLRRELLGRKVVHPNVCQLFDIDPIRRFVSMELLEGNLREYLRHNQGRLSLGRRIVICRQIVDALCAIHGANVIHRDLKPENVLLDVEGNAKVTDFGLSRDLGTGSRESVTATAAGIGTFGYMSPEQLRGGHVTRHSDIYSFGVLAFEVFVGRPLFGGRGNDPTDVGPDLPEDEPNLGVASWWDLPAHVGAVIEGCIKTSRDLRFRDAGELRGELQAACDTALRELHESGVPDLSEDERRLAGLRAFRCPPETPLVGPRPRRTGEWVVFESHSAIGLELSRSSVRRLPPRSPAAIASASRGFDMGSLEWLRFVSGSTEPWQLADRRAIATLLGTLLELPGLRRLNLGGLESRLIPDALVPEAGTEVRTVEARGTSDALLGVLSSWEGLRALDLREKASDAEFCSDAGWKQLTRLRALKRLHLELVAHAHRSELPPLGELVGLTSLHLDCAKSFTDREATDALWPLKALQELDLRWSPSLAPRSLLNVPFLDQLITLRLRGNPRDEHFAAELLPRLRQVTTLAMDVSPESMQHLAKAASVRRLIVNCGRSPIDFGALETLVTGLPSLRCLELVTVNEPKSLPPALGILEELRINLREIRRGRWANQVVDANALREAAVDPQEIQEWEDAAFDALDGWNARVSLRSLEGWGRSQAVVAQVEPPVSTPDGRSAASGRTMRVEATSPDDLAVKLAEALGKPMSGLVRVVLKSLR